MGKISITLDSEGIQVLSFFGNTEEERKDALQLYSLIEKEVHRIDKVVKENIKESGSLEPCLK